MGKVHSSLVALAALAVMVGVFVLTRKGAAENLGRTAVGIADGVFAGVVKGTGALIGVPDTDETRCAAARTSGDTWAASFYCPASEFLGHIFTPKPATVAAHDAYTAGGETAYTAWDSDDADLGMAFRNDAFAETTGGAVTGLVRRK